jgi:hypothetical protein
MRVYPVEVLPRVEAALPELLLRFKQSPPPPPVGEVIPGPGSVPADRHEGSHAGHGNGHGHAHGHAHGDSHDHDGGAESPAPPTAPRPARVRKGSFDSHASLDSHASAASVESVRSLLSRSGSLAGAGQGVPRTMVVGKLADLRRAGPTDRKHTDQAMFSCCSLAPKPKRSSEASSGADPRGRRAKADWELSDGAVYLLRELARVDPPKSEPLIDSLALAASQGGQDLAVTVLKQLVPICEAIGKRPFKRHLEALVPPMIAALDSDSQLLAAAAADCIAFLIRHLGLEILKGRVEQMFNGAKLWAQLEDSPLVPQELVQGV